MTSRSGFSKSRVEHNDIIIRYTILQITPKHPPQYLVCGRVKFIQSYGLFSEVEARRELSKLHGSSSALHGCNGKAPCIAEYIEHALTSRQFLQQSSILPLIDEEAGFLTLLQVDVKLPSTFGGVPILGSAP